MPRVVMFSPSWPAATANPRVTRSSSNSACRRWTCRRFGCVGSVATRERCCTVTPKCTSSRTPCPATSSTPATSSLENLWTELRWTATTIPVIALSYGMLVRWRSTLDRTPGLRREAVSLCRRSGRSASRSARRRDTSRASRSRCSPECRRFEQGPPLLGCQRFHALAHARPILIGQRRTREVEEQTTGVGHLSELSPPFASASSSRGSAVSCPGASRPAPV
jgi:hypothetical protein